MGNVARPQLKLDAPRRVKTIGKHRLSRVRSPQRKMDCPTARRKDIQRASELSTVAGQLRPVRTAEEPVPKLSVPRPARDAEKLASRAGAFATARGAIATVRSGDEFRHHGETGFSGSSAASIFRA